MDTNILYTPKALNILATNISGFTEHANEVYSCMTGV